MPTPEQRKDTLLELKIYLHSKPMRRLKPAEAYDFLVALLDSSDPEGLYYALQEVRDIINAQLKFDRINGTRRAEP